jgi:hypothetical protein
MRENKVEFLLMKTFSQRVHDENSYFSLSVCETQRTTVIKS